MQCMLDQHCCQSSPPFGSLQSGLLQAHRVEERADEHLGKQVLSPGRIFSMHAEVSAHVMVF